MYGYEWTESNGIFRLTIDAHIEKEIRPVFKEELDFFGMTPTGITRTQTNRCFGRRESGAM